MLDPVDEVVYLAGMVGWGSGPQGASPRDLGSEPANLEEQAPIIKRFLALLADACDRSEGPGRIDGAIGATLDFAIASPERFRILFPEPTSAGFTARISDFHDRLAEMLGGLRSECPYGMELPASTEPFLIAGGASVIRSWLAGGTVVDRNALQQQIFELLLIPYFGCGKATQLARVHG